MNVPQTFGWESTNTKNVLFLFQDSKKIFGNVLRLKNDLNAAGTEVTFVQDEQGQFWQTGLHTYSGPQ